MYRIDVFARISWVAPGAAPAVLGTNQANNPGLGATGTNAVGLPGAVPIAQHLQMQVGEQVLTTTALSAITQAQFNTAINNAATDLQTIFAATNSTGQTNLAQAQGWATGLP